MAVTYVTKSSAGLIPAGVVNDDLLIAVDLLRVDVDTAGTGAKGLVVSIEFEKAAI